jgi:hypothetical protein
MPSPACGTAGAAQLWSFLLVNCPGEFDLLAQQGISMRTILLVLLIVLLLGAVPMWPYSTGWGYYPSGGIGLLLLILLVFMFTSRA